MTVVLPVLRGVVTYIGSALLGGQWFCGVFNVGATIAGISGMLLGGVGFIPRRNGLGRGVIVIACGGVVCGETIDAYHYYFADNVPGNYYPWILAIVFIGASMLLAGKEIEEWWDDHSGQPGGHRVNPCGRK